MLRTRDSAGELVRIRASPWRWAWLVVPIGLPWLLAANWPPRSALMVVWAATVSAVGLAGLVFAAARAPVVLTPRGVTFGWLRREHVPWSTVQAVRVDPLMGPRTVMLVLEDGQMVTLPVPVAEARRHYRRFERDRYQVEHWWTTHRGPDWSLQANGPPPPPRPERSVIRLRATVWHYGGNHALMVGWFTWIIVSDLTEPPQWRLPVWFWAVFVPTLVLLSLVLQYRPSVTLTPDALVVRHLRSRRVAWSRVTSVWVSGTMSTRRVMVSTIDGQWLTLPVPRGTGWWNVSQFARGFHLIGQWWADHRGPDWRPPPQPQGPWVPTTPGPPPPHDPWAVRS